MSNEFQLELEADNDTNHRVAASDVDFRFRAQPPLRLSDLLCAISTKTLRHSLFRFPQQLAPVLFVMLHGRRPDSHLAIINRLLQIISSARLDGTIMLF